MKKLRMFKPLVLLLCALALLACSTNRVYFAHDTKTLGSPEFLQDRSDCKLLANATAPVTASTEYGPQRDKEEWTRSYYECMQDKGWYPVDKDGNRVDYICNYFDCF